MRNQFVLRNSKATGFSAGDVYDLPHCSGDKRRILPLLLSVIT
jgi:hypothetical protein